MLLLLEICIVSLISKFIFHSNIFTFTFTFLFFKKAGWKWIHSEWRAPLNEWSNIVVTYSEDVQQCCIYSNGVLRKLAEVRGPLASCDNALQVGVKSFKKTGNSKTRYMGLIADVRLYDRALPGADISSRWGLPTSASERGLIGWWPFDEGTGDTVWDRTSHQQHGEVMGPKWHMGVVVPPSTLSTHMLAVLRDGIGTDVTLRAGGDGGSNGGGGGGGTTSQQSGTVRAHRAILAARCEVFRAMFTIGMKEASQDTVVLSDIQPHTLQMLIEYLYSDELDIPSEFAVDLFIVADRYRLERLQRMCECVILNSLSTENVCHILETADALNAMQLRGIAFRWIIHHFGDVLKSPGFIDLDKSLQREVSVSASQMHFGKRSTGSFVVSRSNSANNDALDDD